MANINDVIRRTSTMVDTSGQLPTPSIQMSAIMATGGGVYPQNAGGEDSSGNVMTGRISLGFVGLLILGAVGFYWWTHSIQGGG